MTPIFQLRDKTRYNNNEIEHYISATVYNQEEICSLYNNLPFSKMFTHYDRPGNLLDLLLELFNLTGEQYDHQETF
jgi:hypothetical protein